MPAAVTTIASFPGAPVPGGDGVTPDGQLFMASNGDLLGATVSGGANGIGTTYEIVKTGGAFASTPTFLADIPTGLNTLLGVPNLSADAAGDLFGLMLTGGGNSLGAVVEFPAAGGAAVTLRTVFAGGAGGSHPGGTLLVDASGNLFGTTLSGGANGAGTVFEIQNTGGVYAATPTTLTSFGAGITPSGSGNLIEDAAGNLFGTTTSSVYEVEKTGSTYAAPVNLVPFPVGTQIGTLTINSKGDIFGTTISGGANDAGSVFEIEKTAGGYVSAAAILASFSLADGQLSLNHPKTLIVDANGDLFGTTDPSAGNPGGVVYEIVKTPIGYDSTPNIVVNFSGSSDVGLGANLVADASGDLFTTTKTGGVNSTGAVLEITGSGFATTPTITPIISSIVWQNTDGQAALWQMDGTSKIASALVNPNPGPGWRVVGSGDFSGNGQSDILWQNASGQAAIWQMDGTNKIAGALIAGNPGPSWTEVGTGDFNGDGKSDILWQNTDGQVAIWEMDGTTKIGSAVIAGDPGPGWTAVGTGDFNGDGDSDILWQNTSTGQAAIWEMSGTTKIGSAVIAGDPGPTWKVIGTGDFNGDGNSDILWQNTSTDQVAIWNMDGTTKIGSEVVADNPGQGWTAIGAGGGGSDILFQNTSGQIMLWEMHENAIAGGGLISPNPESTWHAIGLT